MRRVDLTSLVAGAALVALGVVFLLDREDVIDIDLGALWPMLIAAAGAILLAAGLDDRRRGR